MSVKIRESERMAYAGGMEAMELWSLGILLSAGKNGQCMIHAMRVEEYRGNQGDRGGSSGGCWEREKSRLAEMQFCVSKNQTVGTNGLRRENEGMVVEDLVIGQEERSMHNTRNEGQGSAGIEVIKSHGRSRVLGKREGAVGGGVVSCQ